MTTSKLYILLLLSVLTFTAKAQSRYTKQSLLSTGRWVKIRVPEEGVYQLTPTTLKSMGFSDPSSVRLYGYNLPFLPEQCIENLDDDLTELPLYRRDNGTLLFYSCGTTRWTKVNTSRGESFTHRNNPYSTHIYYFLTEGNGTPAAFQSTVATTNNNNPQTTYLTHSLHEEDAYSFLNTGRTFFEQYDYANGNTKTYKLNLDNTSCGDILLDISFGAAGSSPSTLTVSTDNNNIGTLSFSALQDYIYASVTNKTFTLYDRTMSSASFTLKHTRSAGISGHLDYLRLSYPANLSLTGKNYVVFSPNTDNTAAISIDGADSHTSVWNITTPTATHALQGILSGTSYKVGISTPSIHDRYIAVKTNAVFPTPENMGVITNQNLHALDSINLLIIVPSSGKLTAQAQRLALAHTQRDGIRCAVVEADKVYNEFSSGTPDATAYRRIMKMLYDRQYTSSPLSGTQPGSLNLLLFGNCLWDNRLITTGFSRRSQDDYLLAYESDNSWSHTKSYIAEEYFTLLADGKGISPLKERPDCGVGRLPVSTASEAKAVVDKLISYMYNTYGGAWKNTICMMADDGNANIHMEDAENVLTTSQAIHPNYNFKRIYWDSYKREQTATGNGYPGAYSEINKTMQEGALIMNYTGHGAPYTLSHEQILKTADFQNWSSPRLPLWITAACDVAPFDMNTGNLACEALLNKQGGAMGFIGTSRTVYSSPNRTLNRNLMSRLLTCKNNGEYYTIGEALAQAKVDILDSKKVYTELDTINKVHFILLGDPAIRLVPPAYSVKIERFNTTPANSDDTPYISAGQIVTVEGSIVDSNGDIVTDFDGIVSPTIYDSEEHIVCLNNAKEDVDPFEFDTRARLLYTGADSIIGGKFNFTFPVPIDINYSNESGLMYVHAISSDRTLEANGRYDNFLVGGSSFEESTDTVGPTITAYCDGYTTRDISYTTQFPTIRIELFDESGINTTGSGLGHDIVAIIDGKEAQTYSLNTYYSPSAGDYKSGSISYTLPQLEAGKHTILVRAFDTLNNLGEGIYSFEVVEDMRQTYDILDMSGRVILSGNDTSTLAPGIYVKRLRLTSPLGEIYTKSEKIIVTK